MIELLDFNLRGGGDAPAAAARVARVTERYLRREGARDAMAVVNEMVGWLGSHDPAPRTLRLELSVTETIVRICVTAAERAPRAAPLGSNLALRQTLPVTAALAARYGVNANHRTRVWAEFDRVEGAVVVAP